MWAREITHARGNKAKQQVARGKKRLQGKTKIQKHTLGGKIRAEEEKQVDSMGKKRQVTTG